MYRLQLCALPLVLALLPGAALAQTPDHANDEAPLELPADAPLDLSTPELEPGSAEAKSQAISIAINGLSVRRDLSHGPDFLCAHALHLSALLSSENRHLLLI